MEVDDSFLTEERLTILSRVAPTFEEIKTVRAFTGDRSRLGAVEQFFLAVADVPSVQRRLELLLLRAQFAQLTEALERSLACVEQACKVSAAHVLLFLRVRTHH